MSDLAGLRADFPGWCFWSLWAAAASGPDRRMLKAQRREVTLSAWTAEQLRAKIELEDSPAPDPLG